MGHRLKILIQCKWVPSRYTVQLKMINRVSFYNRATRHVVWQLLDSHAYMSLRRIRSGSWIVEMREKARTQSRLTVQSSHAEAKIVSDRTY
jgi:hypothetical protein